MSRPFSRAVVLAAVAFNLTQIAVPAHGQGIPDDRNINVVGVNPPTSPNQPDFNVPDPGLKQQNEPACAVKPVNPLHILCAFNDYRGVDDPAIGDAWEGYSYSINGGLTWNSSLLPAHPGDTPNIGFAFAADPQVSAVPGLALISYIATDRGENAPGALLLQRMFEANREAGAPWVPAMLPMTVASGDTANFIDKPFMLVHPAAGGGNVTVTSTLKDGTTAIQNVPAARIFLAYTTFLEGNRHIQSRLNLATSDDYGQSWKTTNLSFGNSVNQSASIAAYDDKVCVVWRRFQQRRQTDAILSICSADGGDNWGKPRTVSRAPEFYPFDQGTTETSFRVNSYPVIAADGEDFYAFWASRIREDSPFYSRVVYSRSATGTSWSTPQMLDPAQTGHQFMPAVAAARGTIQVAWFDTRDNLFQGVFVQDVLDSSSGTNTVVIRNKGDVRTAQLFDGDDPTNSVQVSRYVEGKFDESSEPQQLEFNFLNDRLFQQGSVPFAGDYPNVAVSTFRREAGQWVSNIPLADIEEPEDFLITWSDTRDVRGNVWGEEDLSVPTVYTPADAPDVRRVSESDQTTPDVGETAGELAMLETGDADSVQADSVPDLPAVYGPCLADGLNRDRTRNQNIYSSVVRPGVSLESPSSSKPNGSIQRAHVIWVSNNTSEAATYTVTIDNQPPDPPEIGRASFLQVPIAPFSPTDGGLLDSISVNVDPNSTVARTVYITSQTDNPPINVSVRDGGVLARGTITINPDILTPDIQNPDIQNPDIQNPDIQNAEVHNPDIQNVVITTVSNPDVQNPDIQNPDIQNPDIQNPDYQNPDIQNPDIQNPDIQNATLGGSSVDNPDLANDTLTPDERETGYTDITFATTNNGNTTTAFDLDAFISGDTTGLKTQFIASRTHVTETSKDCEPGRLVQNQVIFNLIDPDLSLLDGDSNDGIFGDGSAYIAPGETIYVTLRVWADPQEFDPERAQVRVVSQSCNSTAKTSSATDCNPPFAISAHGLIDFDFEDAASGSTSAEASFAIPAITDILFSGTNPARQVAPFGGNGNSFSTAAIEPVPGGGYFAYFSFTTEVPLELTALELSAATNEADLSHANFDVLLSPADVAAPGEEDLAGNALGSYTPVGTFAAPATFPIGALVAVDLTGTVLNPGTYHIAVAASSASGIDTPSTELVIDDVRLRGNIGNFATIFTESVITGDDDIENSGLFIVANNLGPAITVPQRGGLSGPVVINGVEFGVDLSGQDPNFVAAIEDFSLDSFSPELDAVLSTLIFSNVLTPVDFTIGGLTPGTMYRLQLLFSNDENLTGNDVTVTVEGYSWNLNDWQDDAINLAAVFVATSSSVVITFEPGPGFVPGEFDFDEPGRAVLNGYAVHALGTSEAPVITVPPSPYLLEAQNQKGIGAFDTPDIGVSDDLDPYVELNCELSNGFLYLVDDNVYEIFAPGALVGPVDTTMTCSATDSDGNTAEESFIIRVEDTTPPVIEIEVGFSGTTDFDVFVFEEEWTVYYLGDDPDDPYALSHVNVYDSVDFSADESLNCLPASGGNSSEFPVGFTTVVCTAQDANGNVADDSFQVHVLFPK